MGDLLKSENNLRKNGRDIQIAPDFQKSTEIYHEFYLDKSNNDDPYYSVISVLSLMHLTNKCVRRNGRNLNLLIFNYQ